MFFLNSRNTKFFASLLVLSVSLSATIAFSKPAENRSAFSPSAAGAAPGFDGENDSGGYHPDESRGMNTSLNSPIVFKGLDDKLARGTCTALSIASGTCSEVQIVADSGETIQIAVVPDKTAEMNDMSCASINGCAAGNTQTYIQIACIWEKGRCIPGNSLDQGEL